jgi:ribonuclease BN (tRNA processing enzyme)
MSKKKEEKIIIDNSQGPSSYSRDENGLLKNIQYQFNEDGSVDWRSMIKEEHLFPNKSWFDLRKKDMPRSIEGLKDHQLLIKLSGIKELARLRGFDSISFDTVKCELNHVAIKCTMCFIPNYETQDRVVYEDMANATLDNTSSFAQKFLETIACNRSFVRCVRNFLNIHIVGDDEIDKSDNSKPGITSNNLTPSGFLKKELSDNHSIHSYQDFLPMLREMHKSKKITISTDTIKEWSCFEDISAKDCRILLAAIK